MNIERSRSFAVHRAIALFAAVLLTHPAAPSARAETGVTNIINGVSTNAGGAYWVGNTGPFNALIITNGGTLIATDTGLGYAAASSNNFALVTGAGSLWTNSDFFAVGRAGGGNLLRITDGGKVINGGETRIGWADSASNNTVIVSGAGSVLASQYESHRRLSPCRHR